MTNKQLPSDIQERIKADAEAAVNAEDERIRPESNNYDRRITRLMGYEDSYIAGATAERSLVYEAVDNALHAERNKMQAKFAEADKQWAAQLKQREEKAQVLVDALTEAKVIIQYFHDTVGQTGNSRMVLDNVETALQQWKEKDKVVPKITPEQAAALFNMPNDNTPESMQLPPRDPFANY